MVKQKLQAASVISIHTRLCFHRYASRYEETKGAPGSIVPGVPSPPCYFLEGKLSRGPACSRCTCHGHHYQRLVARQEVVASSRTYLEPPRRIKARPTGLRLERSPCRYLLYVLLYYSPLFSASIPLADFILRRPRRFPTNVSLRFSNRDRFDRKILTILESRII